MRVLITGANGFVAQHLTRHLRAQIPSAEVILTSRDGSSIGDRGTAERLDVTQVSNVASVIRTTQPTHIVHLAGLAALPNAMAKPEESWQVHLHGALNIANAILSTDKSCVLLHVGSGQIYGDSAKAGKAMDENTLVTPTNTYTASKAAADIAIGAMIQDGLRSVRLRPFNHTGPGQSSDFVIPRFASQIARIASGTQPPKLQVGNLDSERDFLDVRDVVDAYTRAIQRSEHLEPGVILNIASGIPRRISSVLQSMLSMTDIPIEIIENSSQLRPSDVPIFVGDATRAQTMLDWKPRYAFSDTLRDTLKWAFEENKNPTKNAKKT